MCWSAARLSGSLSVFGSMQADAMKHFNQISVFLAEDYVHLIDVYEGRVIYSNRVPDMIPEEESVNPEPEKEWPLYASDSRRSQYGVAAWTEQANRVSLGDFDQVVVLSEDAINALFRARLSNALGTHASLLVWSQQGFAVNLGLMKIHLMSDDRAIIFVNIHKATMSLNNRSVRQPCHTMDGIF